MYTEVFRVPTNYEAKSAILQELSREITGNKESASCLLKYELEK